jgi:hypothetical protein
MTYWDKGKKKHNKWQKSRDQPVLNLIQGSGVCMSFALYIISDNNPRTCSGVCINFVKSSQKSERSRHTRLPARQEAGNIDLYYFAETSSHIVRYVKMFCLAMTCYWAYRHAELACPELPPWFRVPIAPVRILTALVRVLTKQMFFPGSVVPSIRRFGVSVIA